MTASSASPPVVCLVDAYSASGGALARAFLDAGCRLCHVHSATQVPPIYRGTFRPELFALDAVATEPGLPARLAREGVRAVLPGTEPGTAAADALAFALGLPGNPPSTSHLRRDKFRMGEAVRAAGLAAVRQASVRSAAQARAIVREWGAPPTVVKPVTSVGSDGVRFCDDEEGVVAAVEALLGQTNCLGLPNDVVLVQERLFGQQYIVNAFSRARRHTVVEIWRDDRIVVDGAGTIYDREVLLPATGPVQDRLTAYACAVLDALDIAEGPSHGEYMLTERGPVLIEVGARLQGGLHPPALEAAMGESLISRAVRSTLDPAGFEASLAGGYRLLKNIACVNLIAGRSGVLVENRCDDLLPTLPAYFAMVGARKVGDPIRRTVDLSSKPGHVFLVHESADQLEADYRQIRAWEAGDALLRIEPAATPAEAVA